VGQPNRTEAFLVYLISDIGRAENVGRFLVRSIHPRGMILN